MAKRLNPKRRRDLALRVALTALAKSHDDSHLLSSGAKVRTSLNPTVHLTGYRPVSGFIKEGSGAQGKVVKGRLVRKPGKPLFQGASKVARLDDRALANLPDNRELDVRGNRVVTPNDIDMRRAHLNTLLLASKRKKEE